MKHNEKFAIIGGGSWATAMAKILCESLETVHWYMRNPAASIHIKEEHRNPNYLSAVEFNPRQLKLTTDINTAVEEAQYLILAIPSAFLEGELLKLKHPLTHKVIYSAIKGIVPESGLIVGEHLHKKYGVPYAHFGVIAGPCHAEEVALERLSYLTIACQDTPTARRLAKHFDNNYIRCSISQDTVGIEYAAMLKNIYAIAAGIFHALNYGDNFQSVLMCNAIREMERYIAPIYDTTRNINASAYLGDLLVTGYSSFSRNRIFGTMIGKGYTVKNAQLEMSMIAEGYYATKSAYRLNYKRKVKANTPIIDAVYNVLYQEKDPAKTMSQLTQLLN